MGGTEPALESSVGVKMIPTRSGGHTILSDAGPRQQDHPRRCPSEQLARLLADAQAELDHLRSITRRAGYQIIFRDPSGGIVDYPGFEQIGALKAQARGGLSSNVLHRIREYVEANLEVKIELADLAAIAHLSRCHFTHAFKQCLVARPTVM